MFVGATLVRSTIAPRQARRPVRLVADGTGVKIANPAACPYAAAMPVDHLAALTSLPGVADAATEARAAVDRLAGQRVLRTDATAVRVEIAWRAVVASAVLADVEVSLDDVRAGSLPEGSAGEYARAAMRVSAELEGLGPSWATAPRQALARLHALAAVESQAPEVLGRPVSPSAARRLDLLTDALTGPTTAPALVVAGVVHAELIDAAAFDTVGPLVARAASRLVLIGRGLDPRALVAPEIGHAALGLTEYQQALAGYSLGTPDGVAAWLVHCAEAIRAAVTATTEICESIRAGQHS
jgi:hypothetical protein